MKYVMKLSAKIKLLKMLGLLFLIAASVGHGAMVESEPKIYAPYPNPDRGYVTDIAGVLTPQQEEQIESWLYTTEEKTNVEIVIVIINSTQDYAGTANSTIESFATGLFNTYGIGNMPKNNGALLVVAIRDRKARIELGAYYGPNRDSDSERIMQNILIPHFKEGDYAGGIMDGARALTLEFAGIRIIPGWVKIVVIIVIMILLPICINLFRNGKRGWGWILMGLIIVLLLILLHLIKNTVQALPKGAGPGGFGGGFGGGFSGGGGATGSW